jgi:hypothetical protein
LNFSFCQISFRLSDGGNRIIQCYTAGIELMPVGGDHSLQGFEQAGRSSNQPHVHWVVAQNNSYRCVSRENPDAVNPPRLLCTFHKFHYSVLHSRNGSTPNVTVEEALIGLLGGFEGAAAGAADAADANELVLFVSSLHFCNLLWLISNSHYPLTKETSEKTKTILHFSMNLFWLA